jgi:hypothetical protein
LSTSQVPDVELIDELRNLLLRAAEQVELASKQLTNDPQWACNNVSLTHYQLTQAADARENILKLFEEQGITPKLPDPMGE